MTVDVRAALGAAAVVAVLRAPSESELRRQVEFAHRAELPVLEITATTPGWDRVLAELAADSAFTHVLLGAGTITTVAQADVARVAGARFVVSPTVVDADVRAAAGDVPFIAGGFTPTELRAAAGTGGMAKLFPAASGGIGHLRAVRDVLPEVAIMPTGGIGVADAADWIAAGAVAVGIGGGLFREPVDRVRGLVASLRRPV
ncbi:bifunctional 4-hydroxy-2-oxoglutarate aldolase/2-dehydro-3-deoxy-phosphogluconate aldolase [Microbacterium thalli]|uniref:Bifunctional 4-hydroxy-2-oxoglutarate aldolase/2-dehydro-3-deoxy-phosphogluconate aldolase n=1 Tax=Microbacterium thalli TaxID=3027921 RepID=A0ABT5SE64_9MICO|nr:bifunctional 4-hydroxy-2-oxoglutarate aldolase/2-dehydro-3-deoxy-phosphogluconate aldolase [Microbacterium thalli]MDD7961087.1 bifunctional 4-hydroxy-2-oxoglutarate aldolase/2-dehydro-3-deoxy-phosphogluconate aldolase [Microbacterium thalli]